MPKDVIERMTTDAMRRELREVHGVESLYGRSLWRCIREELITALVECEGKYKRLHVNQSKLWVAQNCLRRFKLIFLDRIWKPVPPRVTRGGAVDCAVSYDLYFKKETGKDEPLDAVTDVYAEDWKERQGETDWTKEDKKPEAMFDSGRDCLKCAYEKLCIPAEPTVVQEPMAYDMTEEVALVGTPDWIEHSGDREIIRDLKVTGRYGWSSDCLQGLVYSTVRFMQTGSNPLFQVHPVKDNVVPKILETVPHEFMGHEYTRLVEDANDVVRAIKIGFFPRSTEWWGCSREYCPVWHECMEAPYGVEERAGEANETKEV